MTQLAMFFVVDFREPEQFDPEKLAEVEQRMQEITAAYNDGRLLSYDDIGFVLGINPRVIRTEGETALLKLRRACDRYGIDLSDVIGGASHHLVEAELWGEAS